MVVVATIVVPINLLHVARVETISPLDELMHIDYLLRASAPGLQRMSDVFSQEAMHEIACRGHPTDRLPPCGRVPYEPAEFSWEGRNLASGHSPYYYTATGVVARPLRVLLPGDSLVSWARAIGSAWLLAGLGLILAAARRLGVNPWAVVPMLILLSLSPSTQHAATTVNPDATAVFAGGLVLLAAVRVIEQSAHWVWGLLAAVFAVLLDPGNLLIVLAMALFGLTASSTPRRSRLVLALALLGGATVAEVANRAFVRLLGVVDYAGNPQETLFAVDALTGPMTWGESALFAMVPPTKGYMFPVLATPAHNVASTAAILLATVGIVACALAGPQRAGIDRLAACGLALLVLGAPLLIVMRYVLGGSYYSIPPRYGLCMVPILAIAGATILTSRRGGYLLSGGVCLALASTAIVALA